MIINNLHVSCYNHYQINKFYFDSKCQDREQFLNLKYSKLKCKSSQNNNSITKETTLFSCQHVCLGTGLIVNRLKWIMPIQFNIIQLSFHNKLIMLGLNKTFRGEPNKRIIQNPKIHKGQKLQQRNISKKVSQYHKKIFLSTKKQL